MNITDYIVAYLKEGNCVELPGIGTFTAQVVEAHYEEASATMHPTQKKLTFQQTCQGNNDIVRHIAEQECVSMATAQQMFKNYLSALNDKLSTAQQHHFPGLGTLHKKEGSLLFEAEEQLNLQAEDSLFGPLANVKIYTHKETHDPFAQFENPGAQSHTVPQQTAPIPEEVSEVEEPEPEPIQEPEPDVTQEPEPEPQPATEIPATEPEEPTAAPEGTLIEEVTETVVVQESISQPEPTEQAPQEETKSTPTAQEQDTIIEYTPHPVSADDALASLQEMENLKQQPEVTTATGKKKHSGTKAGDTSTKGKRKRKGWLIALLILIVLLLAAGAYYYLKIYQPQQQESSENLNIEAMLSDSEGTVASTPMEQTENTETSTASESATPAEISNMRQARTLGDIVPNNDFTFAYDAIAYDETDVRRLGKDISEYLFPYVQNYAKTQRYTQATYLLKEKVQQYAEQRLSATLRSDGFHVQEFFNYTAADYMHQYYEKDLKMHHAARQRIAVQREIMDPATLNRLLQEVIEEHNIGADAAQPTQAQPKRTLQTPAATSRETTKKGFDIIAGFYVNKASADKMANTLKKKGCDAYIINKDNLYYVSMGSAGSQTEAEALYAHIKEWYKGDVAIKKW